jgi:hypothetical protein
MNRIDAVLSVSETIEWERFAGEIILPVPMFGSEPTKTFWESKMSGWLFDDHDAPISKSDSRNGGRSLPPL